MTRNPLKGLITLSFDEEDPYDEDLNNVDLLIEFDEFRI